MEAESGNVHLEIEAEPGLELGLLEQLHSLNFLQFSTSPRVFADSSDNKDNLASSARSGILISLSAEQYWGRRRRGRRGRRKVRCFFDFPGWSRSCERTRVSDACFLFTGRAWLTDKCASITSSSPFCAQGFSCFEAPHLGCYRVTQFSPLSRFEPPFLVLIQGDPALSGPRMWVRAENGADPWQRNEETSASPHSDFCDMHRVRQN